MLEAFKAAGVFANLFRNRDQLAALINRVKSSLDGKKVTGEGGGGAVKVVMNGRMRLLEMQIDPKLLAAAGGPAADDQFVRQLITDAVNKAIAKAQDHAAKEIGKEMQELGLPDVPGLNDKGI
ncbi:MAG: YbaB/EbfC family nucleoid-associated protein [Phycisphaerales bacterium]